MLDANEVKNDQKIIAKQIEDYVTIIKKEYSAIIPSYIHKYLKAIDNYEDIVHIENTNTISLFCRHGNIYLPTNAYQIINVMRKIPGFGYNRNHSTHDKENMIINNNTFGDYIKHIFIAGLSPREYFEEILLHETMHLCGSGGGSALKEGLNEMKTRELALKYHLKTSCCGYPKEVAIAYQIQELFGKELMDKIAFNNNPKEVMELITQEIGSEEAHLYFNINAEMDKVFMNYQKRQYSGITGPLKKTNEYEKIDYSSAWEILANYRKKKNLPEVSYKKRTLNKGFLSFSLLFTLITIMIIIMIIH